jgi:hypothetical protein
VGPVAATGPTVVRWPLPPGRPRYLRVEVRTPQGAMLALTNPIWVHLQPPASARRLPPHSARRQ